jgi:tetratricopeptide (TPR) repeat protein
MINLRYAVAPIGFALILSGPIACKYTADSEPEQSGAPAIDAPATAKKTADQPTKPAKPEATEDKQEQGPLGEGTDVQRRLMAKAKQAFLSEQTDQAEKLFKALAKTEPVSGPQVSAVIALAQIYNETDRAAQAIALYDSLAERVSDVAEVQLVIARAYAEQGEATKAIKAYKKLMDVQPDYVFAWLELGKLYSEAGREDDAAKALYTYEKRVYGLAEKLENPKTEPAERIHILDIFSLVSDDRATQATVKMLGTEVPKVRQKAATVLGETAAGEAKKVLDHVAINDPNLGVRMAAKDALGRIKKAGVPTDDQIGPAFVEDEKEMPAK